MRLIAVAVPVPALDALTYRVPDETPLPPPGARVLVPLGHRILTGIVISTAPPPALDPAALKSIVDVLDTEPFLPPDVVRLAAWVADYYAAGPGEALAAAMPPRAWVESERHARITDTGEARLLTERGARRRLLEALTGGRVVRVESLVGAGVPVAALMTLHRDGLVQLTHPLKGSADASRTVRVAALTAQGMDVAGAPVAESAKADEALRFGARQREALALLQAAPDGLDLSVLGQRGISAPTLSRLAVLGLVTITRRQMERDPMDQGAALPSSTPPTWAGGTDTWTNRCD